MIDVGLKRKCSFVRRIDWSFNILRLKEMSSIARHIWVSFDPYWKTMNH